MTDDVFGPGFRERLRLVRGDSSRNAFAHQIGVTERQLIRWEDMESKPGVDQILKLAEHTGRSADWWLGIERRADAPTANPAPPELEAFFASPVGQACSAAERSHLLAYARILGSEISESGLQLELTTYRYILSTTPQPTPPKPTKGDSGPRRRSVTPRSLKRPA